MKPFDTFPYTISRCKRAKKKKRFHLISYQLRRYDIFPVCASKNGDFFPHFFLLVPIPLEERMLAERGSKASDLQCFNPFLLPGGLVEKLVRQKVAR